MPDRYQPVACEVHSEYELLAMHNSSVMLTGTDIQGKPRQFECVVKDIQTRQGAEYLVVTHDGFNHEFRLDQIDSIKRQHP